MDLFQDLFDPYERKARIYPALIIILPTLVATYCLFPYLRDFLSAALSSIFFLGITYFLGKFSRQVGKRKQDTLITKWRGMPSERFLRHSDSTVDEHTKKRYHQYLSVHVPNLVIPTPQEESADPAAADTIYRSSVKWLLNKTRDTQKYKLLYQDNISYGFTRNLWAMKPLGLTLNSAVFFGSVFLMYKKYNFEVKAVPPEVWLSFAVTIIITFFLVFLTEETVHSKAKAYARTLLEVCDE
ncbi:hypothetical protein CBW65_02560 [Tumebacillus avium]|uniref:Uncharacterized protein n=1 Tax=Tumebacillus avium TaxID=1903704 RepID=A0A1Y0IIE3_9BACL|nr:hypothetical protein [Tumebacillus avium]ARU60070.1 hypothetical protein CBW65_02560 [Tumebacillus avium]